MFSYPLGPRVHRRANHFPITLMIEMLTPMEAQKLGHVPLTRPYREDYEHEMRWLRTVLRDMRGCNFSLVDTGRGLEVWRDKKELNTIKE